MSTPSARSSTDVQPAVVAKVGGSLYDLPELGERLQRLLLSFSGRRILLVAGGGTSADVVRKLQPVHELSDAAAHRIAMESLRVGERLLCELIPSAILVSSLSDMLQPGTFVVQAADFVASHEKPGVEQLAHDWSVTSDSIAAWIGTQVGADEVLLLKSTAAPPNLKSAAATGHVDGAFLTHAGQLRVSWCNLRADESIAHIVS